MPFIPDVFRIVTITLMMIAAILFPAAVVRQGRQTSAWFAVAGAEVLMIGFIGAICSHFGERIVWYRTPAALLGGILICIFVIMATMEDRNER